MCNVALLFLFLISCMLDIRFAISFYSSLRQILQPRGDVSEMSTMHSYGQNSPGVPGKNYFFLHRERNSYIYRSYSLMGNIMKAEDSRTNEL